ncbi:MAG: AAA family ATPase [Synechococcaceae cyanobacterium]|nr:AAA family ATPase [Synechococcaceae cyanobacterium]
MHATAGGSLKRPMIRSSQIHPQGNTSAYVGRASIAETEAERLTLAEWADRLGIGREAMQGVLNGTVVSNLFRELYGDLCLRRRARALVYSAEELRRVVLFYAGMRPADDPGSELRARIAAALVPEQPSTPQPARSAPQLIEQLQQFQEELQTTGTLNGHRSAAEKALEQAKAEGHDLSGLEALVTFLAGPAVAAAEPTSEPVKQRPKVVVAGRSAEKMLTQLAGLPEGARFLPVVGKSPSTNDWNTDPNNRFTAEGVCRKWASESRWTGVSLFTGSISDRLCWLDLDGEETDEQTGEIVKSATHDFQHFFCRTPDELPPCPRNTSGKPGRWRALFRVPEEWCDYFKGFSIECDKSPTKAFEFLFEKRGAADKGRPIVPCHAVVAGAHPDGNGLHYRWIEGFSPAEIEIPDLPAWVIAGLVRFIADQAKPKATTTADGSGGVIRLEAEAGSRPFEALTSLQREKLLVKHMLPFGPHRKGAGSGTYPLVRRLIAGMANEFGPRRAQELLEESGWDSGNDWEAGKSLSWMTASLARSEVEDDRKANIGSVIHLCTETGNDKGKAQWPESLLPPRDPLEKVGELEKIVVELMQPNVDSIKAAMLIGQAKRLGVAPETVTRLVMERYVGIADGITNRTMREVDEHWRDKNLQDLIEGLIERVMILLVGASHVGKTELVALFVALIVLGKPLRIGDSIHRTYKGTVLWLTNDCSDRLAANAIRRQGLTPALAGDSVRIVTGVTFNNPKLVVDLIRDFQPDLIVLDCMAGMAVSGVSIGSPEYAAPLRWLQTINGTAWEKPCGFIVLTHTSRDDGTRISGTEQLKASVETMLVYSDPMAAEKAKARKCGEVIADTGVRELYFEKEREGDSGRLLQVVYDKTSEQWSFRPKGKESTNPKVIISSFFRAWTEDDDWRTSTGWMAVIQERKKVSFKPSTFKRTMKQLAEAGGLLDHTERLSQTTGKTARHYRQCDAIRALAAENERHFTNGLNAIEVPEDDAEAA